MTNPTTPIKLSSPPREPVKITAEPITIAAITNSKRLSFPLDFPKKTASVKPTGQFHKRGKMVLINE